MELWQALLIAADSKKPPSPLARGRAAQKNTLLAV